MKILALDSSSPVASVAVTDAGTILAQKHLSQGTWQGVAIASVIKELLTVAKLSFADLDLLAVGLGPGSYTGMRIAVTAGKILAMASELPVVGVCSMDAIACQAEHESVAVVLNGRREQFYYAGYAVVDNVATQTSGLAVVSAVQLISQLEPGAFVLCDKDVEPALDSSLYKIKAMDILAPSAVDIAHLGEVKYLAHGADDYHSMVPLYLRQTSAEERWQSLQAHNGNEA